MRVLAAVQPAERRIASEVNGFRFLIGNRRLGQFAAGIVAHTPLL